jgi:ArsR family transcriptional regulator, arsenate/arsenite/antimonite-responsive transcriptional repressor / arsenate reductase (thioredoxin)
MNNDSANHTLEFLKLIAHAVRWQILSALSESDLRVQEITQRLEQPQNLVSYHLQKLKQAFLVEENHSQADARAVYYHLNYGRIQKELQRTGDALAPLGAATSVLGSTLHAPTRILFVCTHNSARSQMAEGMLRVWGGNQVQSFSAGSEPKPIHAFAIQVMEEKNIDIQEQRSKGLDVFAQEPFDYVITVCDRARENCPTFPSKPIQIHWSIPDPSLVEGSEDARLVAFRSVADELSERIHFFVSRLIAKAD